MNITNRSENSINTFFFNLFYAFEFKNLRMQKIICEFVYTPSGMTCF